MITTVTELGVNRPRYIEGPLKMYPDIMFYGFEPSPLPELADALKNLEKTSPNFMFFKQAAWIRNETRKMEISGYKGQGSTIVDKLPCNGNLTGVVDVECIDFAKWIKAYLLPTNRNFLRADIEGSEYRLFLHLIKKDVMKYFQSVSFEPHYLKMKNPDAALKQHQEIEEWLKNNGIETPPYDEVFNMT